VQAHRRWYFGLRGELMGIPSGDNVKREYAGAGSITFAPSEFSRIRLYGELAPRAALLAARRHGDGGAVDRRGVPAARSGHRRARGASVLMKALVVALFAFVAGAGRAEAKVHVVTSIETFADLARRVGGDRVEVKALSHGYMDPHFVEPKPSLVLDLNRADLLVHVGLELEIGWLPPLVLGSRNERIQPGMPGNLDASARIPVLDVPTTKVDRSMGDITSRGQPALLDPAGERAHHRARMVDRLKAIDGSAAPSTTPT